MILDSQLTLSLAQAITVTAASSSIIDLAGVGSGNAPNMRFGVQSSVFGEDIGIGDTWQSCGDARDLARERWHHACA